MCMIRQCWLFRRGRVRRKFSNFLRDAVTASDHASSFGALSTTHHQQLQQRTQGCHTPSNHDEHCRGRCGKGIVPLGRTDALVCLLQLPWKCILMCVFFRFILSHFSLSLLSYTVSHRVLCTTCGVRRLECWRIGLRWKCQIRVGCGFHPIWWYPSASTASHGQCCIAGVHVQDTCSHHQGMDAQSIWSQEIRMRVQKTSLLYI